MPQAVVIMEDGFRGFEPEAWEIPVRGSLQLASTEASLFTMPVFSHEHRRIYTKFVFAHSRKMPKGVSRTPALCAVWDACSGELLLVADGTYATALRTAATSALAAKYLARPDAAVVSIIGAGYQARYQLLALACVAQLDRSQVFDIDTERAQDFANRASEEVPFPVLVAPSVREAVRQADILVTATDSSTPLFDGTDLRPGTHITSLGAYRPDMRELDDETIRRCVIIVDSLEHALSEAGDLIQPLQKNVITRSAIRGDLVSLVRDPARGRRSPIEITLFKTVGFGLQDAILLEALYQRVVAETAVAGAAEAKGLKPEEVGR
jgi:ornithine cyclodeaminase/alanine dehydrogenase-like protein (mu-crystallin family)